MFGHEEIHNRTKRKTKALVVSSNATVFFIQKEVNFSLIPYEFLWKIGKIRRFSITWKIITPSKSSKASIDSTKVGMKPFQAPFKAFFKTGHPKKTSPWSLLSKAMSIAKVFLFPSLKTRKKLFWLLRITTQQTISLSEKTRNWKIRRNGCIGKSPPMKMTKSIKSSKEDIWANLWPVSMISMRKLNIN